MNPDEMLLSAEEVLRSFGELAPETAHAVALGETSSKPKVMGMGIYLELPNSSGEQTTQILITPEGTNEKGEQVPMAINTRTISDWSPRKQWRQTFVRPDKAIVTPEERALAMVEQVQNVLIRQMRYGLTNLRGSRPIVFEMTNVDFTDISAWKAPASALRRIQKARVSIGFPEKVFNNKAPVA